MKKRSAIQSKIRGRRASRDLQVAEFERRDLGSDIRTAGAARVVRGRSKPTSILLDEDLVAKLRQKGARRGFGYQTMLKLIVREHVDEY
jgi:uncharacterized protein (DUF4415 family)